MNQKKELTETIEIEEVIDLEEYSKANNGAPPKARKYRIKIDKEKYVVKKEQMTGHEILVLAGKTPTDRYQLNQKFKGGKVVPIDYGQTVDFTCPGVEKFMTIPLDQNEG